MQKENRRRKGYRKMAEELNDLSRLCIHSITTKPWPLEEIIAGYSKAEVPAITVWRMHYESMGPAEAGKMLRDAGIEIVSLCRGGFFPATSGADREKARTENRQIIDEAAELGAPLIVLVCGAVPGLPLAEARQHILDGIHAVLPHAKARGVRLAIEPLHPMYADDRSAVNTLEQANNMVTTLNSEWLGVTVDVYHCWWDPFLKAEINRAGKTIFSFHVCDWRTPTRHILTDREIMGKGCINIREIRGWVEAAGFKGHCEIEIFSDAYWAKDQAHYVEQLKRAWLAHV
jgi:sugar phosphate isomerase/epimerase